MEDRQEEWQEEEQETINPLLMHFGFNHRISLNDSVLMALFIMLCVR